VGYRQQLTHEVTVQRQLTAAADYNIWQQQFTSSINSSGKAVTTTAYSNNSRVCNTEEKKLNTFLLERLAYCILRFPANIIHRFDSNRVELVHFVIFSYGTLQILLDFEYFVFHASLLPFRMPDCFFLVQQYLYIYRRIFRVLISSESEKKKIVKYFMFILR
jgi:hypothetical protein